MATNGLDVITPSSVSIAGTSASINSDGSVSFNACTTLVLNDVFSADYENYMVVTRFSGSGVLGWSVRMRNNSGNLSSGYNRQTITVTDTSISTGRTAGTDYMAGSYAYGNHNVGQTLFVYCPYALVPVSAQARGASDGVNANVYDMMGTHPSATSYPSLVFITNNSPVSASGLVTVFGLVD